jgi:hypothetical protein
MTEPQTSVIPAAPWYESETQVRAVLAMAAQLVSVGLRIAGHLGLQLQISGSDIDGIFADLTQGAAIWLGALAIIKRQKSAVAPLTLTASGAVLHAVENPSLLDADPTKIPKETKPNA